MQPQVLEARNIPWLLCNGVIVCITPLRISVIYSQKVILPDYSKQ